MAEAEADIATMEEAPSQSVRVIFAALMLVMLLATLDQTIVSTALPRIVAEFGGLERLSWIVTAYMLATTIVTPLYGKLGDLFGRKLMLQSAIGLFLVGSMLCGIAGSMTQLIFFRAVQGLGGGGLMITTMAVVADIISPRERGRYQGLFGGVAGLSTVLGPLIGGYFVEHLSWRWIFYINLPLGLIAFLVIGWTFTAPAKREKPKIDVAGAALLALGLTALVLATSLGGHTLGWGSPPIIGLILVAIAALIAFVAVERRATDAIMPLSLFANRTFVTSCSVGFIVGLALFGSVTYLPVYLQLVKGQSPAAAGLQLTPMMGGVFVSSIASGQIISRIGRYRMFPIIGTAIMTISLFLISMLQVDSEIWMASFYALLLGIGLGMVMQVLVLAVQNTVDYRDLGVATSGSTLFRSIGGSVGVSLFGAIFAASLAHGLSSALPETGARLSAISDPAAVAALPPAVRAIYLQISASAFKLVFLLAGCLGALAFLISWFLKEIPLRGPGWSESIGESFAIPRDATSLGELETIVEHRTRRENRWPTLQRIADRVGINLTPDELWLLLRICERSGSFAAEEIAHASAASVDRVRDVGHRLVEQKLAQWDKGSGLSVSLAGREMYDLIVSRYSDQLTKYLERWSPEDRTEVRTMLERLARDLLAELPITSISARD